MTSSQDFLDVAFLGVYRKLREEGGDIRNKYGVREFILESILPYVAYEND